MEELKNYKNFKLENERILLRAFVLEDADRVAYLCDNYKIHKNTLTLPYPYTIQDAIDFITYQINYSDPDREMSLAIVDKNTEKLVGSIGLICSQIHKRCEAGYWIGEEYWNMGYATDALKIIIKYLFEIKGYNKVYGKHFDTNPSSGKVMEKAGMVYEGAEREHYLRDGEYLNVKNFSMLKREYK